ncbi:hypothetical protein [Elizabethkingia anophelis]|uniref:hypothetical protein n=1 Tax=Elizabethkingia anophelis TaxID=1117645 RepID=UPI0037870B08
MQKEFLKDYAKRYREDSIRAVNDSEKQYSYFINRSAPSGPDNVEKKEIGLLLEKKGIKWGGTWIGTDLIGDYTDNECYYFVSSQISVKTFLKRFNIKQQNYLLKIILISFFLLQEMK